MSGPSADEVASTSAPGIVTIRRVEDGAVREARTTVATYSWWWSDGNGSCDCARAHLFAWAGGEPDPQLPCGDGRFRVTVRISATGEMVYSDDDDEADR